MELCLVEEYSPKIINEYGKKIIALTPKACYNFDKNNIQYSIIEDYVDIQKLLSYEKIFYNETINQLKHIDKEISYNVFEIYSLILKSIIDPIFIRTYMINELLDKTNPSDLVFVCNENKKDNIDDYLYFKSGTESIYSRIINGICNKRDIDVLKRIINISNSKDKKQNNYFKFDINKRLHFLCKYLSIQSNLSYKKKFNIFLMESLHIDDDFIIQLLKNKHTIYYLEDNTIYKLSPLRKEKIINMNDIKTPYKHINKINFSNFMGWLNDKCCIDVSHIILPRLEYFESNVYPKIINYTGYFTKFFNDNKMDFFITSYQWKPEYFSLLLASKQTKTKTICIDHGNDIFISRAYSMRKIFDNDIFVCSNYEMKKYLESLCMKHHVNTKIYESSYQFKKLMKINKNENSSNKKFIYLPIAFFWDIHRLDGAEYYDTWYYKFLISIIDFFSKKTEYEFIYKTFSNAGNIYNPVIDYINDNKFNNITTEYKPYQNYLSLNLPVIMDFPSTAFYESIIAEIPVLSLYHKSFVVRKSALDYFNDNLQCFSNADDAKKHIDNFISNPRSYVKKIMWMNDKSLHKIIGENNVVC